MCYVSRQPNLPLERAMRKLVTVGICLVAAGCFQERNKSIEMMNQGVEAGRQKLYDTAVNKLKQATTIDPTNAAAYYNLGLVYKDQKKWSDAESAFRDSLKYDTDNPALHYELGS